MKHAWLVLMPALLAAQPEVDRNGRFEQTLRAGQDAADPLARNVVVEFAGPGGVVQAPAFWDGERVWKVRFRPEQAGRWTFRAPEGFTPRSGEFRVREYRGPNELLRRGAPRVSADRRHFVYGDGSPWFFLSCTGWNAALWSTAAEWRDYVADRAAKRFTAIQFVMTQWRAGRQDERGQVAFHLEGGQVRVNPAFFQRLDSRFDALNAAGLVAAPVLLWALASKDLESPGISLDVPQATRLARYMVTRYRAHHVLWILGGDGDYAGANAQRWKQIGRGVFPQGEARGPVTLHPRGMRSPWPEYKDEPWVDFFMYQSGHGGDAKKWRWNATQGGAVDWKLEPPHPVVDGEPNYEAHLDYQSQKPVSDYQVRRAAYYSLLAAPPAGVSYGAHGIWYWARKNEVPLDHPGSGVAAPWRECLHYPGAQQMKVLRDIFDSVEWWKLRPERSLLAEDTVDEAFSNYVMPAWTTDGRASMIYVPAGVSPWLNLAQFGGTVNATWMDPRTGKRFPPERWKAEARVAATPPGEGDWILVVRK